MRHLDLFSGYGGFTIPAKEFGIETINFSEIDKYASAVLKYRFPNIPNLGDVSQIDTSQLPDFDLLTGGTPCQDLSLAGKRKGLSGERSGLFFQFVRILKEKQPRYFIWENVKGALSSNNGWDFARVQIEMEQAGYSLQWAVLNAKDFGVPQNRERIFVIGIRGNSQREILPIPAASGQALKFVGGSEHRKKWLEDGKVMSRNFSQGERVYSPEGIASNLSSNGGGLGAKTGLYAVDITRRSNEVIKVGNIYPSGGENGVVIDPRGISKTLKSGETNTKGNGGIGSSNSPKIAINIHQRRRGTNKGGNKHIAPSVTQSKYEHNNLLNDGVRIRRLTPTECERLMGLEDGWTSKGIIDGKEVEISDTQRYKMCGNGCVTTVVKAIYQRLIL